MTQNPAISDGSVKPKSRGPEQDDLLRPRLTDMIDMRHELVNEIGKEQVITDLADWLES